MAATPEQAEQETLILDAVDRFLERDVRPYAMELEHNDTYPAEIVEKMKELGLFGSVIAEEYGGLGLSCLTYAKIVERVARVWMSLSGIFNSHLIMAPKRRSGSGCRNSPAARSAAVWH
jgi:alkylation response protein AidB-like acyl-CoA dehydrogenase